MKDLNNWDSGVWRKEATQPTSLKFFKMVKGLSGIPVESMFELSTTKHFRGHELKLTKHRSKLEVRRHFFTERLVNRSNSLDHLTVNASTVNSFKNGRHATETVSDGFLRGLKSD